MQLLAILTFCTINLMPTASFAGNECKAKSIRTSDILSYAEKLGEVIDRMLNETYKRLVYSGDIENRELLIEGERLWAKFRDARCDYVYNSIYLGAEAKIERQNCVVSLTHSRLLELIYIENDISSDSIYRGAMASGWGGGVYELNPYINKNTNIPEEKLYFDKNCKMINILHNESAASCMARMKTQNI